MKVLKLKVLDGKIVLQKCGTFSKTKKYILHVNLDKKNKVLLRKMNTLVKEELEEKEMYILAGDVQIIVIDRQTQEVLFYTLYNMEE